MLAATRSETVASGQPSIKIDANRQKSLEDSNKSEGLFGAVEAKESGGLYNYRQRILDPSQAIKARLHCIVFVKCLPLKIESTKWIM